MTDTKLYAMTIPAGTRTRASTTAGQRQARQALQSSDVGNVQTTGTEPSETPLTVEYPDDYAAIRAAELAELARGISEPVPYFGTDSETTDDGYYRVSQGNPGPVDPRSDKFQRVDLTLDKVGTARSHYRSIKTAPRDMKLVTAFGSTSEAHVAAPLLAKKVRWFDPLT